MPTKYRPWSLLIELKIFQIFFKFIPKEDLKLLLYAAKRK